MKIQRKVVESGMVLFFGLCAITFAQSQEKNQLVMPEKAWEAFAPQKEAVTDILEKEKVEIPMVAKGKELPQEVLSDVKVQPSPWEKRLMPKVEDYLNIRTEPDENARLEGKLYKGAMAEIIESGAEWSKIISGNVEGYVKNSYCVFGAEAEALAKEQGVTYATSLTGGLRVRKNPEITGETGILDLLEEGEKIKVNTEEVVPEGWVSVFCGDTTGYIYAEYVSLELELKKAISIEEELAAIKKAQEEEAAREAKLQAQKEAEASAGESTETAATVEVLQKGAVAASYDEVTLLGALIQCEAGGECYEGQVAVGAVVMNRLRSGYAGSISGVIYQSGQFSPVASGALDRVLASGVNGSCLSAAQEALNGIDNVNGATSFRNIRSGRSGLVIGNHVFF